MNYIEALDWIHSHKRFASQPTLDRIRRLMELLGNPQKKLKFVHIAGTNGKGSTAAMTASILREAGCRTGLTISPYILDFCERMQIDGEMISQSALVELVEEVKPFVQQIDELTEFEVVTALAFLWFWRERCEIVVAEVGLGGQFDATNVIDAPLVAVITKIGLDHTEILGDTVEKIALEKAAIIKSGCSRVIIAPNQPEVIAVIRQKCEKMGCNMTLASTQTVKITVANLDGTSFYYKGKDLYTPLAGEHQVENAVTVTEICLHLEQCAIGQIESAIQAGFAKTRFPARLEVLQKSPLIIIDGAHNPDGAEVLAKALAMIEVPARIAVLGMAADKDVEKVIATLVPLFTQIVCTQPDTPRALEAQAMARLCERYCDNVSAYAEISKACEYALEEAQRQGGAVIVCGSFYLAAPARTLILGKVR